MKGKQLRFCCTAAALACTAAICAGVGVSQGVASASGYTSVGDRYFYSNQADVVSYLDKPSSLSGYVGVRTEVTPHFDEENATIAYKGLVNATQEVIPVFDNNTTSGISATSVIVTYTAASDPTKQLSFVSTMRGKECWTTVSLTNDLTFIDGYTYVGDSEQATVALLNGKYDTRGFNTWDATIGNFKQSFGFCYNSAWQLRVAEEGDMKLNPSTSIANVLSDEYLAAASENLPESSPYKQRYTKEYVTETIQKLKTESILTIEWIDIQVPTVGVNIRGINGQWVTDNGGVALNVAKPYATVTTDTLYANKPYKTSDLFVARANNVTDGVVPYVAGFIGATTWNTGEGTWFNTSVDAVNRTIKFTDADIGKEYKVITQTYSNGVYTPCYQIFTFTVAKGTPKITEVENASYLIGQKHDLAQYFDVWQIGETPTYAYTVDGVASSAEFIPTQSTHEIGLTVTDEYGNTASCTYEVNAREYSVPTAVTAEGVIGLPVALPVPQLPQGTSYTVEVYKGETLLTSSAAYAFAESGEYKLVYKFAAFGMTDGVRIECAYTLTMRLAVPEITVDGEYAESYYVGNTITLLPATATDGQADFDVESKLYLGGVAQTLEDGAFTFATAGEYEVVYVCTNGTQTVKETRTITVLADEEKPQIIVNGAYATQYQKGATLMLLEANVVDNSGETLNYTVTVALNGKALTVDEEFVLDKAGTYTVTYVATDKAGNVAETQFTFTVKAPAENSGCASAMDLTGATVGLIGLALGAAWLLRRKKDEN